MLNIGIQTTLREAIPWWLASKFSFDLVSRLEVTLPSGHQVPQEIWCCPPDVIIPASKLSKEPQPRRRQLLDCESQHFERRASCVVAWELRLAPGPDLDPASVGHARGPVNDSRQNVCQISVLQEAQSCPASCTWSLDTTIWSPSLPGWISEVVTLSTAVDRGCLPLRMGFHKVIENGLIGNDLAESPRLLHFCPDRCHSSKTMTKSISS